MMKRKLFRTSLTLIGLIVLAFTVVAIAQFNPPGGATGAKRDLSNLTSPTAINLSTLSFVGTGGLYAPSGFNINIVAGGGANDSVELKQSDSTTGDILVTKNNNIFDSSTQTFRNSAGGTSTSMVVKGQISTPVNVVTFSATPAFNVLLSDVQKITLTANVTSFTIINAITGQTVKFIWLQDATGGRTVSGAPANMHGFTAPGTTASTYSIQSCTYDGAAWVCGAANVNIS
jgi:hypothetical protein